MIAFAVLSASIIAVERWTDDSKYVSVEICAEYESAVAHADQLGYDSLESYLPVLRESGVTSVGMSELSFADVVTESGASVVTGREVLSRDTLTPIQYPPLRQLLDRGAVDQESLFLIPANSQLESLLDSAFSRGSIQPVTVKLHSVDDASVIEILGDRLDIEQYRFGLRSEHVQALEDSGLGVVPRLTNPRSASTDAIDATLASLGGVRECSVIIFAGTEVLGHPHNLEYAAVQLLGMGLIPGMVEFSVQRGDRQLAELVDYEVIRVHSIVPSEYPTLSADEMLDRLLRAVSERNVRLLYLRPHLIEGQLEDGNALDFINSLRYRLESEGYVIGPANAYPRPSPTLLRHLLPIMALGAIALGLLIVLYVYPMSIAAQVGLALIAGLTVACIAYRDKLLARLLLSLGVAVLVPAVAVLVSVLRTSDLGVLRGGRPVIAALRGWLLALTVAVAGGLVVAGILSDRSFFSKSAQFLGVKASHTLPFVLASGLLWWHRYGRELVSGRLSVLERTVVILRAPIRVWHLLIALIGIVGFVVYLGRTGNSFFIDIPVFDRWLREAFESFLPVRPRTKEVLIGHPVLIVSLYVYARSRGRCLYALAGVLAGTVGLISIVNSFAHLHTPIATTLTRVLLGAALSLPVAMCGIWLASILFTRVHCDSRTVGVRNRRGPGDSEVC